MCVSLLFLCLSSDGSHSCDLLTYESLCQPQYDESPPVCFCSCLSPDVHEWRSVQLEETLPVPAWLHRSTLPVSTPADAASAGGARQQAARLPSITEA